MTTATTWEEAARAATRFIVGDNPTYFEHVDQPRKVARWIREQVDALAYLEFSEDAPFPFDGEIADYFSVIARMAEPFVERPYGVVNVIASKQADYGHGNIERFGTQGLVVRLSDKVERLLNLLGKNREPSATGGSLGRVAESLADTWLDIVGYSIIGVMWEHGTFMLPLERDLPEVQSHVDAVEESRSWWQFDAAVPWTDDGEAAVDREVEEANDRWAGATAHSFPEPLRSEDFEPGKRGFSIQIVQVTPNAYIVDAEPETNAVPMPPIGGWAAQGAFKMPTELARQAGLIPDIEGRDVTWRR